MSSCKTCQGTPQYCLSCWPQFYRMPSGTCVKSLPNGYYLINGSAFQCNENCLTCSGVAINCTSCRKDSKVPYFVNGMCLAQCPITHYSIGLTCYACSTNCLGCLVSKPDYCTSCRSNMTLTKDNKCIIQLATANNTNVFNCSSNCLKCTGDQCDMCELSYLINSQGKCINQCPVRTYSNFTHCLPCLQQCLSCSNKTTCDLCDQGYYLNRLNQCVVTCDRGTYKNKLLCSLCL
jgi:proprotein convertase subtilisin/kexin type 5